MSRSKERVRRESKLRALTIEYNATQNPRTLTMRGMVFLRMKRYNEALQDFNGALSRDLSIRDAWNGRIATLISIGDHVKAFQTLNAMMEKEATGIIPDVSSQTIH